MRDRKRPIVGEALAREGRHHRDTRHGLRVLRVVANRDALIDDGPERAQEEVARLAHMHVHPKLVAGSALRAPIGGEAEHLRVQRADVEACPFEGEAGGDEPGHKSVDHLGESGGGCVTRHQPILGRAVDRVRIGDRNLPHELHVRRIFGLPNGRRGGEGLRGGHHGIAWRAKGSLRWALSVRPARGAKAHAALAALARPARLRSFGSRITFRSRIDFGVTSTSSSSAI